MRSAKSVSETILICILYNFAEKRLFEVDCKKTIVRATMKYAINREFGIFRKIKPPLNKVVLRLALAMSKSVRSTRNVMSQTFKVVADDGKSVPVYVFSPKGSNEKLPAIIYLHGGGFVFKGAPYHYRQAKHCAEKLNAKVVFVDYRLAFQGKYLVSLQDCFAVYRHFVENADKFGVDTDNIGLVGDSAGGYLALALCKMLSEHKLPLPKYQTLVYPVVDPEMSSKSMKQFVDTPMWNAKANAKMWQMYSCGNTPYNPLSDDLSFMPQSYVETAQFDCLHDEGAALHNKLLDCGVKSVLNQTVGTMHGFDICRNAPTTQKTLQRRIDILLCFMGGVVK